jgi:hypothetical protein
MPIQRDMILEIERSLRFSSEVLKHIVIFSAVSEVSPSIFLKSGNFGESCVKLVARVCYSFSYS